MPFAWILMILFAPDAKNFELACAIDSVARESAPLYRGDENRHRTIATLTALAFFESRWKIDAVGDHGKSVGAFQRLGGPKSFLTDARASTIEALKQVRESFRACGRLPVDERLSLYARGRCDSERGRELSRDRMRLAFWMGKQ